jgi:hypothetical protein
MTTTKAVQAEVKAEMQEALSLDIKKYLASGGTITVIPTGLRTPEKTLKQRRTIWNSMRKKNHE